MPRPLAWLYLVQYNGTFLNFDLTNLALTLQLEVAAKTCFLSVFHLTIGTVFPYIIWNIYDFCSRYIFMFYILLTQSTCPCPSCLLPSIYNILVISPTLVPSFNFVVPFIWPQSSTVLVLAPHSSQTFGLFFYSVVCRPANISATRNVQSFLKELIYFFNGRFSVC